jgi:hypothetical protein
MDRFMSHYQDDLRESLFIRIPKIIFEEDYWRKLPSASKSIYPVILKHINAQGTCFPSEETISKLAGVTPKTVREGLKGLDDFPGFEKEKYITQRGHSGYRYIIEPVAKEVKAMSISHAFFNGGNWSELTPCAKAIYPALKYFSWWHYDLYIENEEIAFENDDEDSVSPEDPYPLRKYDFINPDNESVAQFAGIDIRSIRSSYQSLIDNGFMEYHGMVEGRDTWELFTRPSLTLSENITY